KGLARTLSWHQEANHESPVVGSAPPTREGSGADRGIAARPVSGCRRGGLWAKEGTMLKRRVLLVEDHPMFRRGLRRMLEETGRFTVVGEAQNGHEAIHLADIYHPDLLLIDVQLPGVTGLK